MPKSLHLALWFFLIAIVGCSSRNEVPTPSNPHFSYGVRDVSLYFGIPQYVDTAHFIAVSEELEQDVDDHSEAFVASYPQEYTADQLDSVAELTGFHEEQPLIDFAHSLGFESLRDHLEELRNDWIESDTNPNLEEQPELAWFNDAVIHSMMTKDGEFIIGDHIYWISTADNIVYAIEGLGNIDVLPDLKAGNLSPQQIESMSFITMTPFVTYSKTSSSCRGWGIGTSDLANYGDRRMYSVLRVSSVGAWTNVVANSVSQKKRPNNKWKDHKANLFVVLYGRVMKNDCNTFTLIPNGKQKSKKKKKVEVRQAYLGVRLVESSLCNTLTCNEGIASQHRFESNFNRFLTLIF